MTSFDRLYTANVDDHSMRRCASLPMTIRFRGDNRRRKGTWACPCHRARSCCSKTADLGPSAGGSVGTLKDRAMSATRSISAIGQSSRTSGIAVTTNQPNGPASRDYKIDVTNARNEPVNVEIEIPYELKGSHKQIEKIDGVPTWKATVACQCRGQCSLRAEAGKLKRTKGASSASKVVRLSNRKRGV
jgi:hypothetical protein